jgi:hypothetical protein
MNQLCHPMRLSYPQQKDRWLHLRQSHCLMQHTNVKNGYKIMIKNNTPLTLNTLRKGEVPEVRMVDVSASAPKSLNCFP